MKKSDALCDAWCIIMNISDQLSEDDGVAMLETQDVLGSMPAYKLEQLANKLFEMYQMEKDG